MIHEIKRGNTVIWSGKAIGRQYRRIMQEDRVEVTINTASAIKFKKGDMLVAYGQTYKLNRPENISKKNTQIGYSYEIEFEALYYDFGKWILYTLDKNNSLKEPAVYLMGDAKAILGLVIQNANRASSGWTLGVIDDTEVFQWTYNGGKLLTVIQDIADQTNLEFWFDNGGKRLNLTRRQPVTGIQLAYGKGKGLYELYRSRRDNPVVTHLTILGGSQNIPNNYGFREIQPTGGNPMVNPNYVAGMDRVENTVVYENIYPRLIAKVTATSAPNVIRSTDIDFNLNDHLLDDGTSAQIAFTSGLLNGFKFTIQKTGYVHATRQVTFNIIQDDKAYPGGVPDTLLKPAVGDSFVFLNIDMPATYVTNAEGRVKDTGDQYFAEEGVEQFDWSAKITPKFALENNTELVLGGLVHLKADDIGFDGNIRIDSYSRDLQESYRYDFTLSNIISINSLVRQRNQSDRLANTVTKGISSDGLSTKATYAERAGYAGTAGHAATATNAATANFASEAAHAALADHATNADHALKADLATRAIKADLADNSILWNGLAQPNYLTQPVRPVDSPKFEGVSSPSFQSGWTGSGYRVSKDANGKYILEVDGLFVRGEANFYSLVVNELRATNGALIVSDGIEITGATKTGNNYVCTFDTDGGTIGNPFRVDDVVKCQVWNGKAAKLFVGRVLSTTSSSFTISILQGSSIPTEGDHIVRIDNFTDNNRKGIVYITASDSGAPYVDTVYGMWTSPSTSIRTRMGNLSGIVHPTLGTLTGFGLYAQGAYIDGVLVAKAGSNVYNKGETQAEISNAEGRINLSVTNKIDGIKVGGRNLLSGSKSSGLITTNSTKEFTLSTWAGVVWSADNSGALLVDGETYTIGYDAELIARTSVPTPFGYQVGFALYNGTNSISLLSATLKTLGQKERKVISFVAPVNSKNYALLAYTNRYTTNGNTPVGFDTVKFTNLQLEKGNKDTDWGPAYEDIDASIDTVKSSVSDLSIVVDGHTEQISLRATKTEVTQYVNANYNPVRHIRDYLNGSNVNAGNHWVEIEAIDTNNVNVALGKPVSSGAGGANLNLITNGNKSNSQEYAYTGNGENYVQIDLGAIYYNIKEIRVWHYYADGRKYKGNVTQVSTTGAGGSWTVLFNSNNEGEYVETSAGKTHYNLKSRDSINNLSVTTEAKITLINDSISLKADRSVTDGLNTRLNSAEAKITPDAINATVRGQVNSKSTGEILRRDPTFLQGNNGMSVYNNLGNGVVTFVRENVPGGVQPTGSPWRLKVTSTGSANPNWGGIAFQYTGKVSVVYNYKLIASIPVGRRINHAANAMGTGSSEVWLTSQEGTGKFEEYVVQVTYGTGAVSSSGFFHISGGATPTPANPLVWYVAFATVYNVSSVDDTPTVTEVESSFSMTANKMKLFSAEIEMSGIVTFQGTNAQNSANAAQGTANTANTKAGQADTKATNAQTAANTADGKAVAAQNTANAANGTANAANNQVNAWKYPNKTTINGGAIETKSIKALQIDVENLFAEQITATNLTVTGTSKVGAFRIVDQTLIADMTNADTRIAGIRSMSYNQEEVFSIGRAFSPSSGSDEMCYLRDWKGGSLKGTGLRIDIKNKLEDNIAIDIVNGTVRGIRYDSEYISINSSGSRYADQNKSIHIVNIYGGTGNFGWSLPTEPKDGEVHYFLFRKSGNSSSWRVYVNGGTPPKLVDSSGSFASGIDLKVGFLTKFIYVSSIGGWITDMLP